MDEHDVDVVVVGAGGGSYPAAFFLDRAVHQVVMVDPIGNLSGDPGRGRLPPPDDLRRDQQRCTGASRLSTTGGAQSP